MFLHLLQRDGGKGADVMETIMTTSRGASRENMEAVRKTKTRDGMVKYLAEAIPCSCLDEERKEAKARPKMSTCEFCRKEETKVKLFRCSRCKFVRYCSKECQTADWKKHKHACSFLKEKMEKE
jgi:hypothetical protein